MVLISQALPLPRILNARKAEELTGIVKDLGNAASFRNIMREAARVGAFKEHKTLRRYFDAGIGSIV